MSKDQRRLAFILGLGIVVYTVLDRVAFGPTLLVTTLMLTVALLFAFGEVAFGLIKAIFEKIRQSND